MIVFSKYKRADELCDAGFENFFNGGPMFKECKGPLRKENEKELVCVDCGTTYLITKEDHHEDSDTK